MKKLIGWGLICFLVSTNCWGDIVISDAAGSQRWPRVVWSGEKYLVVWHDNRNGDYDIYAQFLDSSGCLIDSNFVLIPTSCEKHLCDICASDSTYFVLFSTPGCSSSYGAIVSFRGALVDTPFLMVDTTIYGHPQVAWNGTEHLVVWNVVNESPPLCIGRFFSMNGVPSGDTFLIASSIDSMGIQAIAANDHDFLLLFADWHYPHWGLIAPTWGMIIHSTGPPIDTLFCVPPAAGNVRCASSDGDNFLVVEDGGNPGWGPTYCQMVSSQGSLVGPYFAISDSQHIGITDVSSNGLNYFAVLFTGLGLPEKHVVGQFVSSSGALMGTDFVITPTELDGFSSGLSCDGNPDNYLVAWDREPVPGEGFNIYGCLVPSAGVHESESSVPLRLRSFPTPCYQNPDISLELDKPGNVSLNVWDAAGRLIEKKDLGYRMPGVHVVSLDKGMPSGVYFCSFGVNDAVITRKLVVLR